MAIKLGVSAVKISTDTATEAWIGDPPTLNGIKTWHDLGYTSGGVRFRVQLNTQAIECDQSPYPVVEIPTTGSIEVEVPLLNQTAANLKLAFLGEYDDTATMPVVIQQINQIPNAVDLRLETAVMDGVKTVYIFTKVRPIINVDASFSRDAASVLTITFRGTADSQIGVFEEAA